MEIQNLPKHSFKVKLKEYLLHCTSDNELDHLLLHFSRAIDRLKVLYEKLAFFLFLFFDVQQFFSNC